jgi:predicted porin
MAIDKSLRRAGAGVALLGAALAAQAQTDYSAYGVADFSYGRFEPSGFEREHRFNSNSLSASFVGVNASYGFDGGWKPGITLETFLRFEDFDTGRNDSDPFFSRNAFVSLASPYGEARIGRLQTLLFDTTSRFNALGNSPTFSPAIRHIFRSGNLEGVQGDFYWDRAVSYVSPTWNGVTGRAMYSQGPDENRGDPTDERTWQLGATYNFGWARLFGLYTHTDDKGLDVRSNLYSAGAAVPVGPGTFQFQAGLTKATGPAVDRKHTSVSAAYLYAFNSVTDFYIVGMNDRVRGQTEGVSVAIGGRYRF